MVGCVSMSSALLCYNVVLTGPQLSDVFAALTNVGLCLDAPRCGAHRGGVLPCLRHPRARDPFLHRGSLSTAHLSAGNLLAAVTRDRPGLAGAGVRAWPVP